MSSPGSSSSIVSSTQASEETISKTLTLVDKKGQSRTSEHPVVAKKPRASKTQNPPMLSMVLEALKNKSSRKGQTTQGIKRYIVETYPSTKEGFSNARLRQALTKGLESKEIIRPKSAEEKGLKGYFLLNRELYSQKGKIKQGEKAKGKKTTEKKTTEKKTTEKTPVEDGTDNQPKKRASKASDRKMTKSDSSKSAGEITPQSKSKQKPSKSLKKASGTISGKKAANRTFTVSAVTKHRNGAKTATPKPVRSSKAGAKRKTTLVKKLVKKSAS